MPRARVLMVQGTSSHAGKSIMTAALCRIFTQDGFRVAPFKAQNMSLNAAVTPDGGEIGRAQMLQAQAARALPRVEMNPILLKPEAECVSQIVIRGRVYRTGSAQDYYAECDRLWPIVTEALDTLRREYDVVVIEGAGSPAEINLRDRDIVNMRVARYAGAPVVLVGDIERGGVFAALVGTMTLLEPAERALVRGFIINKFRGDPTLLEPGPELLRQHTGVPTLGVLPFWHDIDLPEEDALGRPPAITAGDAVDVAVIRYPHIANADDLDPLRRERGVGMRYIDDPTCLGAPDLIILPGSKTTIRDLAWMRERGLAEAVLACRARGTAVIGICGGYQMLGRTVRDVLGVESGPATVDGLGLLESATDFSPVKQTHQVHGTVTVARGLLSACAGMAFEGYEIHMGDTPPAPAAPLTITRRSGQPIAAPDGALDAEGYTFGTYVHGLFQSRPLRRGILEEVARRRGKPLPPDAAGYDLDTELDKLAAHVRRHLDIPAIYALAGLRVDSS